MSKAVAWTALAVVVTAVAVAYAMRPSSAGTPRLWLGMGVPYLLLTALGLVRLRGRRALGSVFALRRGDPSLGIVIGLGLLAGAWLTAKLLLPADSVQRAWLLQILLVPGNPSGPLASLVLLTLVACEEVVWRGWVQAELRDAFGPRRGWMLAATAYALAHLPSVVTLSEPAAGANPLLVLAAWGCGLCWSFLAERSGRLWPGMFSHGVFSYFAVTSFWLFV